MTQRGIDHSTGVVLVTRPISGSKFEHTFAFGVAFLNMLEIGRAGSVAVLRLGYRTAPSILLAAEIEAAT